MGGQGEGDTGKLGEGEAGRGFGSLAGAGAVPGEGKGKMLGELRAASPDPKAARAASSAPRRWAERQPID